MKKIVLVVLIFFSNISIIIPAELDYFLFPLIRFSYDFNLGFTTSIGGGVMFTKGEAIGGPYFLYSFSNEFGSPNLRGGEYVDGKNFSVGLYGGVGFASFRVGVNKMIINDTIDRGNGYLMNNTLVDKFTINQPASYWGLEASSMFLGVTSSGGFLFDGNSIPKFNGSIGLGIF